MTCQHISQHIQHVVNIALTMCVYGMACLHVKSLLFGCVWNLLVWGSRQLYCLYSLLRVQLTPLWKST